MTPIQNIEELKNFKSRDMIPLKCEMCQQIFYRPKNTIQCIFSRTGKITRFCSQKCHGGKISEENTTHVICNQCGNTILKVNSQITKNNFCNQSCAAKYSNAHKTKGTCRSKLEKWLETHLTILYPKLEFNFNRKDAIFSELDIYIPSLKLAFELNGIFHYEPIYGDEKLSKIQTNDNRKFQACFENKIGLCVIDTSSQKYFKENTSQIFLDIIVNIINKKMAEE